MDCRAETHPIEHLSWLSRRYRAGKAADSVRGSRPGVEGTIFEGDWQPRPAVSGYMIQSFQAVTVSRNDLKLEATIRTYSTDSSSGSRNLLDYAVKRD